MNVIEQNRINRYIKNRVYDLERYTTIGDSLGIKCMYSAMSDSTAVLKNTIWISIWGGVRDQLEHQAETQIIQQVRAFTDKRD